VTYSQFPLQWTSKLLLGVCLSSAALSTFLPPAYAKPAPLAPTEQAFLQEVALDIPIEVVFLRLAIIGQESNGKFQAVNRHSGALGYGQVMPENVGPWSKEALGYPVSPQAFLQNPALQIQVIDFKLKQYWQAALTATNGDEALAVRRVAAHWYSGRPHLYTSTRTQYYGGHRYPSIADYTLSVLSKYQQQQQIALQATLNLRNSLPLEMPLLSGMPASDETDMIY
jgi:hypothetical protein